MVAELADARSPDERAAYVRELGWREFAHHVLHHFPHTTDANFNPRFDDFDWAEPAAETLYAWQHGQTGVPIVDAGMRELWATGWMHNRVRMIVASFLTKHLRIHWRHGARWFWDTLVDADLANNTLGWQWVAGTGCRRCAVLPRVQPRTAGPEVRPPGRLHRTLGARTPRRIALRPPCPVGSACRTCGHGRLPAPAAGRPGRGAPSRAGRAGATKGALVPRHGCLCRSAGAPRDGHVVPRHASHAGPRRFRSVPVRVARTSRCVRHR